MVNVGTVGEAGLALVVRRVLLHKDVTPGADDVAAAEAGKVPKADAVAPLANLVDYLAHSLVNARNKVKGVGWEGGVGTTMPQVVVRKNTVGARHGAKAAVFATLEEAGKGTRFLPCHESNTVETAGKANRICCDILGELDVNEARRGE